MPIVPKKPDYSKIVARERTRAVPKAPSEAPPESGSPAVEDYQVGYGRPPIATRFQPGKSGNPSGRPRGSKNLSTIVEELLDERVLVRTSKGERYVTAQKAMVLQVRSKALKADLRATDRLVAWNAPNELAKQQMARAAAEPIHRELSAADAATLDAYRTLLFAEAAAAAAAGADGQESRP
jgi:hypothetical protein